MRTPDFENNTLRVLRGEKPERVPLFELFMNDPIYTRLAGHGLQEDTQLGHMRLIVDAMAAAGYDYATCNILDFHFPQQARAKAATESLNGQATITDWETFEAYKWPNAAESDYTLLEKIKPYLPEGMKLMVMGPCGVLENVISLVGYDNLCYMLFEEPELVQAIFDHVGAGLVSYYEQVVDADTVGFLCSNDDWGFNTQTFLSTADRAGYMLGSGNSIPEYVPHENYLAMIRAALDMDR